MANSWILVANSSLARIYEIPRAQLINGHPSLKLVKEYEHPESRKKDQEIASDKFGSFKQTGHGNFAEATSPKDYEVDTFAREIATALDSAHNADSYQDLILVIPPKFYGVLNKHLHANVKNKVSLCVEKNYTDHNEKTLLQQLERYL